MQLKSHQVKSIGEVLFPRFEVGVATSNGKAYYRITSLLNGIGISYVDILMGEQYFSYAHGHSTELRRTFPQRIKVIITTRKERLQLFGDNVICIEDLGDDLAVAKERLFALLYPAKATDWFVVGIDPGERTGVAAFMNHKEVETAVLSSFDQTINRVSQLLDNAPSMKRLVKIGAGNIWLAERIARALASRYRGQVKIQLVDERGTSTLSARRSVRGMTRDQRAATLIAFRDGQDYVPVAKTGS